MEQPKPMSQEQEKEQRTVRIPLTQKQKSIIEEIKKEQTELQEKFTQVQKREHDIINFLLEYEEISASNIENLSYEDGKIIITKKSTGIESVNLVPNKE